MHTCGNTAHLTMLVIIWIIR